MAPQPTPNRPGSEERPRRDGGPCHAGLAETGADRTAGVLAADHQHAEDSEEEPVKRRTAKVRFAGSTFTFRAADWRATRRLIERPDGAVKAIPTSLDLSARP